MLARSGSLPAGLAVAALLALAVTRADAQAPCPAESGNSSAQGWEAYRRAELDRARSQFERALGLCPSNVDARVGLGFVALRGSDPVAADTLFRRAVALDSANADAWEGLARAAQRLGDSQRALAAARRSLRLAGGNRDLRHLLSSLEREAAETDTTPVSGRPRPAALQLVARTRGERFEVATRRGWTTFYIKGVNLGVALPGRYPSEFPADSARYAGWLDTLAAMHANTLRLYTILPPAFYRALRAWNLRHPDQLLWLVHGVWTELPPEDDFDAAEWKAEFRAEMRRVVDIVHGSARVRPRPGHASGRYDADVSRWTLGYIIGREWEPYSVKAFDADRPGTAVYRGRFLEVKQGPAMDRWMAEQCDYLLAYEVDSYNALRPIAYTNWPTLDPLAHPTESNTDEESAWRRRAGRPAEGAKLEYENDAIGLDANLVRPTAANPAGWFASYHAYPYYPDFMIHDSAYSAARSSEGRSNYFGYLRALIAHHAGIPTVISEYGVPSSRGIAHLQPQGWDHGGHDERAMAAIDARLTREIREAGGAGSILFAWLDEWFKKNWVVIDYEIPLDHTRRWHNVMDAEQNYGIMGEYAGDAGTTPVLGGDLRPWRALRVVQQGPGWAEPMKALRAGADESYLYLAVELARGRLDWKARGLQLAIDTYLPRVGQHRLPRSGVSSEVGFEFLVDLAAPDSATLRVTPDYNRHAAAIDPATGDDFGRFHRRPVISLDRSDGRFDSLFVVTNRARFGRDGTFYRATGYDRGRLNYGAEAGSTLADWFVDEAAGLLELRLSWDLLNVTDPSTRTLLFDRDSVGDFGTVSAEDFRFGVLMYGKGEPTGVIAALPALRAGVWPADGFVGWRWTGWTEPRSHARLKPVYDSLKALWAPRQRLALTAGEGR